MSEVSDAAKTLKECAKQLEAVDILTVLAPSAFHDDGDKLNLWKELKADMTIHIENRAKVAVKAATDEAEGAMRQVEINFKVGEPAREEKKVEVKVLGAGNEDEAETEDDIQDAEFEEVPEDEPTTNYFVALIPQPGLEVLRSECCKHPVHFGPDSNGNGKHAIICDTCGELCETFSIKSIRSTCCNERVFAKHNLIKGDPENPKPAFFCSSCGESCLVRDIYKDTDEPELETATAEA